jgi:hypothetical protein
MLLFFALYEPAALAPLPPTATLDEVIIRCNKLLELLNES